MNKEETIAKSWDYQSQSKSQRMIYEQIILNTLKIGDDYEMIADILLQTISDFATILAQLSWAKVMEVITPNVYNEIVKECLLMLHREKQTVLFNPLNYNM